MKNKQLLLCSLLIVICSLLPAIDFGLVLDQKAEFSGEESGTDFLYKGILIPRFSGLLGDRGSFHISAGLNYEVDPVSFIPELLRTDFYWLQNPWEFRVGRMTYQDPLGFIAAGLFDGTRFSFNSEAGTFSAGGWYTGLLNKIRANIEMTPKELELYDTAIEYSDFAKTYFAPKRVLAALDWEHQGLWERIPARLSFLGQFDLGEEELHSQYLAGKLSFPAGSIIFDLGGSLEFLEVKGDFNMAFAAEAGLFWKIKSQQLSFLGRYSSGQSDSLAAFLPLTTVSQGHVLGPKLSGISLLSLDYNVLLHRTLSLDLSSFYFIRSDSSSFYFYGNEGRLLGAEFYAGLYWNPVSDFFVNIGGGAFLPSLGNAAPKVSSLWRFDINLIISLY